MRDLDDSGCSLGIPTWHYGHEPPNAFSSVVAKYFRNAIREDVLLEVCRGGIVFLPGAAGTVQEVFQAACANYYADESDVAPMLFVGREYWTETVPAWPLVSALAEGRPLATAAHLSTTRPKCTGCSPGSEGPGAAAHRGLRNPRTSWHDLAVASTEERLRDLARLRRVRDRIDREYAQPLDVEALARGAHMSAGHLSRQFRMAYGESPYGYLMTRRIERAMALLRRGDLSVTEVCFAVGCSSLGTFSTRFTELVGVPPSVYRRQASPPKAEMPPCVSKQVTRPIRNREAPAPEPHLA